MCGIIGATSARDITQVLLEGLRRLEYRGYDSAGIAILDGSIKRVRAVGRVSEMQAKAESQQLSGLVGIGHTRWATHGGVTESNAHPHVSGHEVAVVHNGIIENHDDLRAYLRDKGYEFTSETDTEVVAHLIHHHYASTPSLLHAVQATAARMKGAFSLAVLHEAHPNELVGLRQGSPLVLGLGVGEKLYILKKVIVYVYPIQASKFLMLIIKLLREKSSRY